MKNKTKTKKTQNKRGIKEIFREIKENKDKYKNYLPQEFKNKIFLYYILLSLIIPCIVITFIFDVKIISFLGLLIVLYILCQLLRVYKYVYFGNYIIITGKIDEVNTQRRLSGKEKYILIKANKRAFPVNNNKTITLNEKKDKDIYKIITRRNIENLKDCKVLFIYENKDLIIKDGIKRVLPLYIKYYGI